MNTTAELLQQRASVPIPANIAELTGPLILGNFFAWALLGALTVQAYIYYLAFPNDRKAIKAIAAIVYILEWAQTVVLTNEALRCFGTGFGDMVELNNIGLLWFTGPVMGGVVGSIGQIFYAWRIHLFSKSYLIPGVAILLSLMQGIAAIYVGSRAAKIKKFTLLLPYNKHYTPIWLGGTAACDIIIAITMTYYLLTVRTGIRSTKKSLVRIVRLSLETGAICAACASLELALFFTYSNNYHLAPASAISKLYSNSLFAVLNSRGHANDTTHVTLGDSALYDTSLTARGTGKTQIPLDFSRSRGTVGTAATQDELGVHVDVHVEQGKGRF